MRALAGAMTPKVTAQAISKYEAGRMLPSSAVLVGLGKALGVSLDFLMGGQVEGIDGLEFRRHSGASARDRVATEAILIDRLERYLAIEHILGLPTRPEWRLERPRKSVAGEGWIDESADALRDSWRLGTDPIPSLCELLESKGIKVVEADLPESVNGLSCHVLQGGGIVAEAVVVSSRVNVEHKRFTLAHELAHRVLHGAGISSMHAEKAMNRFAGAFLLPGRRLRDEAGPGRRRIAYYEIIRLKRRYGVSAAAVLMRLGQVGVLTPAAVRRAFATFARSWRASEPEPIGEDHGFANLEKPRRFDSLVSRALGEELISPARAADLLGQPLDAVERLISGSASR